MTTIIGIDLGTTNTAFSLVEDGVPKIIPNKSGYQITPSIVSIGEDILIGRSAKRQIQLHPKTTIHSAKRFIGRKYSNVQRELLSIGYDIIEDAQGECSILIKDDEYKPQEIAAILLRDLKQQMEEYTQNDITEAVITVPAYFDDHMRQATKEAGVLVGLDVLRIINEPTAAALAYASVIKGHKKIAVYDFGGGTFDISILEMEKDLAHVQSTRGDNALGGNDIDLRLVNYICDQFQDEQQVDLRLDPISFQRVIDEAERVKCDLSSTTSSSIYLPFICTTSEGSALNLETKITRDIFEGLIIDLVDSTIVECKKALKDAQLQADDIDEVILVGGSSRIPLVQQRLSELFSCRLNRSINPEEVVALGAAIQANMLSGDVSHSVILLDVTPFSLGIEEQGGRFKPLIHRNSTIPTEVRRQATTVVDNQRTIKIHILQGEDDMAKENISLGEFELSNISPADRGVPKIDIRISLDSNGIVKVSATDTRSGRTEQIQIERDKMLSSEALERSREKIEAISNNSVDDLKIQIQKQLAALAHFIDTNKEIVEVKYVRALQELKSRSSLVLKKTDSPTILRKLLHNINVIYNDLEDHTRPQL